jgi:hypothetical protein
MFSPYFAIFTGSSRICTISWLAQPLAAYSSVHSYTPLPSDRPPIWCHPLDHAPHADTLMYFECPLALEHCYVQWQGPVC